MDDHRYVVALLEADERLQWVSEAITLADLDDDEDDEDDDRGNPDLLAVPEARGQMRDCLRVIVCSAGHLLEMLDEAVLDEALCGGDHEMLDGCDLAAY